MSIETSVSLAPRPVTGRRGQRGDETAPDARSGRLRRPAGPSVGRSISDLLIAATAEKAGLTVLAVDKDFDLIAEVTGQSVETLALV